MNTETNKNEYKIDAAGKRLGRIATEAAAILLGKNTTNFTRHNITDVTVKIENASKMDVTEKRKGDPYKSYSGYPGGQRVETLGHLGNRLGFSEVLRRTISGMLPKNKLRKPTLHNLEITE